MFLRNADIGSSVALGIPPFTYGKLDLFILIPQLVPKCFVVIDHVEAT